jgi:hypothetical protein
VPTNLLVLPFLAGFLFTHISHGRRFRAQRLDGYRLIIESAAAGFFLLVLARICVVLFRLVPGSQHVYATWDWAIGIRYLGTGCCSIILGVLLPWLGNHRMTLQQIRALRRRLPLHSWLLWIRAADRANLERAIDHEIALHGNALIRLLHNALKSNRMISITLENRKWYVGYVAESLNLDPQESYFRLLPIMSGYRDRDDLRTVPLIYYPDVYAKTKVDKEEFKITIPFKDIKGASLFDEELYEQHFAWEEEPHGGQKSRAAGSTNP